MTFFNPTVGKISLKDTVEEVFNYFREYPQESYEIVVGCDSSSNINPAFPVAIVVLRKGCGGRFFLAKIKYPDKERKRFTNVHSRIIEEVYLSCEVALIFKDLVKEKGEKSEFSPDYQFEYIHADVGRNGLTKDMIKEVTGFIKSNGFIPKIKPESFAASIIADRFS